MAEIVPDKGSRVVFKDIPANRMKGIALAEGTVVHRQDYVLHVEMDERHHDSVLPSGLQFPTLNQVEVIEDE